MIPLELAEDNTTKLSVTIGPNVQVTLGHMKSEVVQSDLWHHITEHMTVTTFIIKEVDCLLSHIPHEQKFLEITALITSL